MTCLHEVVKTLYKMNGEIHHHWHFYTIIKKFGFSRIFLFFKRKVINTFIQQGHINLSKSASKTIYNVTKG